MFIGVVVWQIISLVIGRRNPNLEGQPSLTRSYVVICALLLVSPGIGYLMFRHESDAAPGLSLSPCLG